MNILIVTQDEKLFLPSSLDYFIRRLPSNICVSGIVKLPASPYGKKLSLIRKLRETLSIFGPYFLLRYAFAILSKILIGETLSSVAELHKLQVFSIKADINHSSSINLIKSLKPDLLISVTANQIFKSKLLGIPPLGSINLHTSLLPRYRGLMPTFWALKNREKVSGVSVFFIDEGIDSGPIIVQKEINLNKIRQWDLIRLTKFLGMEALIEALTLIENPNFNPKPNPDSQASYFGFPTKKDVLDFRRNGGRF